MYANKLFNENCLDKFFWIKYPEIYNTIHSIYTITNTRVMWLFFF